MLHHPAKLKKKVHGYFRSIEQYVCVLIYMLGLGWLLGKRLLKPKERLFDKMSPNKGE